MPPKTFSTSSMSVGGAAWDIIEQRQRDAAEMRERERQRRQDELQIREEADKEREKSLQRREEAKREFKEREDRKSSECKSIWDSDPPGLSSPSKAHTKPERMRNPDGDEEFEGAGALARRRRRYS